MFPKKGNHFPSGVGGATYPAAIAAALGAELGNSHQAAKTIMRWTGANERTVKNWLAGRRGPRGEHLLLLIRHSDSALETTLQLAGRDRIIAAKVLLDARNALADMVVQLDSWMNDEARRR